MHDILEGILQYEIKLMLQFMINCEGYFSLDSFNSYLDNLELGYMERNNRPTTISVNSFTSEGNSRKQNGLLNFDTINMLYSITYSFTDVALGTHFATHYWRICARR